MDQVEQPSNPLMETAEDFQPFDPRWITVERIGGAIAWAMLLMMFIGILIAVGVGTGGATVWFFLCLAVGIVALGWLAWLQWQFPVWQHERSGWRMAECGLEIRKGVWFRSELTIPKARVQHTDVSQGPLLRRYDLAKLIVHTAGTKEASIEIPGLRHATACQLRDQLIQDSERGKKDVV